MISENLHLFTDEAPCTEAEFLNFVQDKVRYFYKKAKQVHNMLNYFNNKWVLREIEFNKDRKVHDVLELLRNLLLADLVANTQVKNRNSAFKFILNGGSLNCYPVIRGIAISRFDPS